MSNPRDTSDVIKRIERLREDRAAAAARPSLSEQRRYNNDAARIKQVQRLKADATLHTLMGMSKDQLQRRRRHLRQITAAWRETVESHPMVTFDVVIADFRSGEVTVIVQSSGAKYLLERVLRAGGFEHFQRTCKAPATRYRVRVGELPPPLAETPRRTRSKEEEEEELLAHVDSGLIDAADADKLIESWNRATTRATLRDATNGKSDEQPPGHRKPRS